MRKGYKDLREYIAQVEALGSLRHVAGAALEYEIGGITEYAAGTEERPALLFDDIPGFPRGHRIFTNACVSPRRAALALGLSTDLSPIEALNAWKDRRSTLKPIPTNMLTDGPVLENVQEGADVDLGKFPAPIWHRHDGGPYIGSGSLVVTRDPDTGWINASIYRVQVHGPNQVTIQYDHNGRHGAMISRKYWERGQACPVAIVNGEDPALFIAGFEYLPENASEYEFAGAIKGMPIDIITLARSGLPVPAHSELVLEGELLPFDQTSLPEGPFGEFTGYYASEAKPAPVMNVQTVYHRNNPIILGSPPLKPPRFHFGLPFRAAAIWSLLETAGVTDVVGAWQHVSQLMTVIAIRQRYAGHAKRAGLIAAANSYMGRLVVVVDEDVDPSNLADVMWAVTTRCEPSEQVDIIREGWSSGLDPRLPREKRDRGDTTNSKMIIDACKPFAWKDNYPISSAMDREELRAIEKKWAATLK